MFSMRCSGVLKSCILACPLVFDENVSMVVLSLFRIWVGGLYFLIYVVFVCRKSGYLCFMYQMFDEMCPL